MAEPGSGRVKRKKKKRLKKKHTERKTHRIKREGRQKLNICSITNTRNKKNDAQRHSSLSSIIKG